VFVLLINSSVNGDGSDTNAIGLRLEPFGGKAPYATLSGAVVFGEYRGLEAVGESGLKASGSTFISVTNIPVELREQGGNVPNAQFSSSAFTRLEAAASPAFLLSGSNAATLSIVNSRIEAPGHSECFGLSGLSSANIHMANSVLSTNLGTNVTILSPSATLNGVGNVVIP